MPEFLSKQSILEDALEQLTDEEYIPMPNLIQSGNKTTALMSGLPSTKRYLKELRERRFSRTMISESAKKPGLIRWEQLLAIPDFLERQITPIQQPINRWPYILSLRI